MVLSIRVAQTLGGDGTVGLADSALGWDLGGASAGGPAGGSFLLRCGDAVDWRGAPSGWNIATVNMNHSGGGGFPSR